jgi:hypothetical protein
MPTQLLVNVLRVPSAGNLAVGDTVTIQHGLKSNDQAVLPTLIQPDRASPMVVVSVTATEATFQNNGTAAEFAFFRFERGLSNEVDADTLTPSYWKGSASGGAGTVTFADLGLVQTLGGPYPAIPAGTPVSMVAGSLVPSDAAIPATAPCVGIYTGPVTDDLRTSGPVNIAGIPADTTVYLAPGGGFTATPPSTAGQFVQRLGMTRGAALHVDLGESIDLL